jgi:hypothetical protein
MRVVGWLVDASRVAAVWRRDRRRMKQPVKSSGLEKRERERETGREGKGERERRGREGGRERGKERERKREERNGEHANKAETMWRQTARGDESDWKHARCRSP